jgi:polyadenylate-binding protein
VKYTLNISCRFPIASNSKKHSAVNKITPVEIARKVLTTVMTDKTPQQEFGTTYSEPESMNCQSGIESISNGHSEVDDDGDRTEGIEDMLRNASLSASPSGFENSSDSTLYITDLNPLMTEAHLFKFFTEYGPVKSIRVVKDSVTRRSLGYAFVKFTNPEDAKRALEDPQPKFIEGRSIRVLPFEPDPSQRRYNHEGNIFIKNVDPSISPESLFETFSAFGTIVSCKIATDDLGMSKGFAYILFETKEAADAAISKMNGVLMNDRKVYVDYHMPKWERINKMEKLKANVTEDEFRDLFVQYGSITSLSLPIDVDGRCRGFGFVNYEAHEDAARAVEELNDYELRTKKLYVSRAQKKYEREEELRQQHEFLRMERFSKYQGANLYVKFLGPQVTDQDLSSAFSEFGTITSAKVMTEDNGQSRGFGFVCFQNADEAQKAINAMHEKLIWGNKLYVALALRKDYNKRGGTAPPPFALQEYSPWSLYSPMLRTGAPYVNPGAASHLGLSFPLPATARTAPPVGTVVPTPPIYYAAAAAAAAAGQSSGLVPSAAAAAAAAAAAVAAATGSPGGKFNRPPGSWPQSPFYGPQLHVNSTQKIRSNGANGSISSGSTPNSGTSSPKLGQQRQFSNGKAINRSNNNGRPSSRNSQRQSKPQEAYGSSLLAAIASAANPDAEKQVIGEALYPKVLSHGSVRQDSTIAAKITGMLLEQDRNEVLKWFDDEPVLTRRIQQAYEAYSTYLEQQRQGEK